MIFDTDVLIWFLRGDRRAAELIGSSTDRAVSLISVMELFQGTRSREEIKVIRRLLLDAGFRILPVTEPICHSAASLMEAYAVSQGLQVADALIAATAREAQAVLATANARHFRAIPSIELKVFRPTAR